MHQCACISWTSCVIIVLFVYVNFSNAATHNSMADHPDLEIEKYIPSTIRSTCTVVILSKHTIEFRPVVNRPVMLLTEEHTKLLLKDYCNIIVIPDLTTVQGMVLEFMLGNRINTEAILVYSFPDRPLTIKQVRTFFRELDVVLIDVAHDASTLYQYPIRCGLSLTCKMQKRLLRVGFTSTPPTLIMRDWAKHAEQNLPIEPFMIDQTNRVNKYFTGPESLLLALLVNRYQMRFKMKAPRDFGYGGTPFPNGSYPGKFGMLQRGEVDMLIGAIATSRERGKLGSYTPPIAIVKYTLISLKDQQVVHNWDAAIRPFPKLAWCILALSIVVVAPVTWFVTKKHRQLMNIENIKNDSIGLYFAHATATLLVEPWPRPPGGPAAIIVSVWFLACLVLQSIYASNFTVSLSFPVIEVPIRSLQDCLDRKRRILVSSGSSIDWYLKHSRDPVTRAVYNTRVELDRQHDENLFANVDNGLVAVLPTIIFYDRLARDGALAEKYFVSDISLMTTFGTWMFERDDVNMAREIGTVVLRCSAAGLLTKWENRLTWKLQRKSEKISGHAESIHLALSQKNMALSMEHLEGIFKFWLFGILLGILTFTYEITYRPTYNAVTGAVRRARIRKELLKYTFLD